MSVKLNEAMSRLGISQSEAQALDSLDGKSDGKIQQSIFDEAKSAYDSAEKIDSNDDEGEDKAMRYIANLGSAGKAIARTIARKMGLEAYFFNKDVKLDDMETLVTLAKEKGNEEAVAKQLESLEDNIEGLGESAVIQEDGEISEGDFIDEIKQYYEANGSLAGFKFTNVPEGVKILRLDVNDLYDKSSNDIVEIDENGNAVTREVIDGIQVEIHFQSDDNQYVLGGTIRNEEE